MNKDGLETIVNFLHQVRQLLKESRELKQLLTSNKETIKIQKEQEVCSVLLKTSFSRAIQFQIQNDINQLQKRAQSQKPEFTHDCLIFYDHSNFLNYLLIYDEYKQESNQEKNNYYLINGL
ncbi:unnamed protein product [Paramecium octaurelia]|uniref:Uncharacterized protein n=1 Tax=Paramecium octaurelia TaxID=43137 RepID=A0A8S1SUA4_PAROT|nr:unnamed protein product [Paramecium octaurelia]